MYTRDSRLISISLLLFLLIIYVYALISVSVFKAVTLTVCETVVWLFLETIGDLSKFVHGYLLLSVILSC